MARYVVSVSSALHGGMRCDDFYLSLETFSPLFVELFARSQTKIMVRTHILIFRDHHDRTCQTPTKIFLLDRGSTNT